MRMESENRITAKMTTKGCAEITSKMRFISQHLAFRMLNKLASILNHSNVAYAQISLEIHVAAGSVRSTSVRFVSAKVW